MYLLKSTLIIVTEFLNVSEKKKTKKLKYLNTVCVGLSGTALWKKELKFKNAD